MEHRSAGGRTLLLLLLPCLSHGFSLTPAFRSASGAVLKACAAFGPQHEASARLWLENLDGALLSPAELPLDTQSLWLEERALFDMCAISDDQGLCRQLEGALQELKMQVQDCSVQGFGEDQPKIPPWCRARSKGTFASVLPPQLVPRSSSGSIELAANKVRAAAAALGPEQAAYTDEWLSAEAENWADASTLYARRVPLFDECGPLSDTTTAESANPKCEVLRAALDELQGLLDEEREPHAAAGRADSPVMATAPPAGFQWGLSV